MLKLRKPFSQKVQLHIRQDLLQKLWDKYVPEDSAEYGRIELIYPDAGGGYMGGEPRQIQILVNLVLRNRILQAGLSGAGGTLAAAAEKMEGSVLRAEKCFLTQLRCYDVRLYRAVNRYVTLLEQFREEGRRYQNWQRENRMIERQRTEYRLFSAFSSDIKNFLAERSVEILREMERELIRVLPEGEYRILARQIPNLTEPKEFMLQYLDVMEVEEIRQLWEQLEGISQESIVKIEEEIQQPQRQIEEMNPRDTGGRFREKIAELRRRYEHEVARSFHERVSSILSTEPYQMLSEPYQEIADMVLGFQPYEETVDMALSTEPYQEAADMTDVTEEAQGLPHKIRCMMNSVQMKLEAQKEQLWQHEAKVFETYRELYREAKFSNGTSEEGSREDVSQFSKVISEEEFRAVERQFVEETFLDQYQGEMREEELRDICEWGRVFAELFANPIPEKQKFKSTSSKTEENRASGEHIAWHDMEYHEEWVYLTQEVSRYMEEHGMETFLRVWRENVMNRKEWISSKETRLVDAPFQKLWEWGEALRDLSGHDEGKQELPEEATLLEEKELRELIAQMNHALQMREFPSVKFPVRESYDVSSFEADGKGNSFRLEYTDVQFQSQSIQSLLRYARELNEEQYEHLLGELSKITQIQWRLSQGQEMEEEAEQALRKMLVQRNRELLQSDSQRRQLGLEETDTVDVPYLRMWEWGEALLHCPEYAQNENADSQEMMEETEQTVPVQEKTLSEDRNREQAQWIRRQIKEAKDRNNLQQLISQINHRLEISRKTEQGEAKAEETIQLTYADSQLTVSSVQSLLHYIRNLDEEGYGVLVKELAQVTKVQGMLTSGLGMEEETAREVRQMFVQRKQGKTSPAQVWEWGKALRYYPEHDPLPQAQKERRVTPSMEEGEGQPRTHLIYTDDRNNLQQMIWQINRMTAAQQLIKEKDEPHSSGMMETDVPEGMSDFTEARSTENVSESKTEHKTGNVWDSEEDQSWQTERRFRLVYAPSQLQSPSVHDLLDYIRYLNKEQYESLIEELTKVTSIQQRLEEAGTRTKLADISQRIVRELPGLPDEKNLPYKKSLPEIQTLLETKDVPDVQTLSEMKDIPDARLLSEMKDAPDMQTLTKIKDAPDMQTLTEMKNLSGVQSLPGMQDWSDSSQTYHGVDYGHHSYRESYLELAHRIRQYEVQRRQTMKKNLRQNLRQIQESYSYPNSSGRIRKDMKNIADVVNMIDLIDIIDTPDLSEVAVTADKTITSDEAAAVNKADMTVTPEMEDAAEISYPGRTTSLPLSMRIRKENESMTAMDSSERAWNQPERAGQPSGRARQSLSQAHYGYPSQELASSIQATDSSQDEQQRTGLRLQEENIQIKSVQEQLGKKLTEVEEQLKAVEGAAKAKQDVRAFTDQIKRQLYEELHVEKLRRGLI